MYLDHDGMWWHLSARWEVEVKDLDVINFWNYNFRWGCSEYKRYTQAEQMG